MRYGQLVMGPEGCGKSTYCSNIVKHCEALRRPVQVINLDPAAEHFDYPVYADVRELIHIDDAMEDESLHFGPNGGLVFCMEYLIQNLEWLEEQLDEVEDDYILFDLPGQIELYTHIPAVRQLVERLQQWNFRLCGVFLLDAQFLLEPSKLVSGMMTALAAMASLEVPHINVLSKLDLLSKKDKKNLDRYLDPDLNTLLGEEFDDARFGHRFKALNKALATMVDDYSLVRFLPLDPTDDESINDVLTQADLAIQYGEDLEHRDPREHEDPEEPEIDSGID
eukprot:TRINITY_DN109215_c0_g2_i1.p1 TRINITY_DN109215_c0_g2~~TRINITY_DN109215_c0_g2_i1.p1  ORF type:complete len:280 (-),score=88.01 TRINITY_DN109215_c0_g2_i1:47-886(-)